MFCQLSKWETTIAWWTDVTGNPTAFRDWRCWIVRGVSRAQWRGRRTEANVALTAERMSDGLDWIYTSSPKRAEALYVSYLTYTYHSLRGERAVARDSHASPGCYKVLLRSKFRLSLPCPPNSLGANRLQPPYPNVYDILYELQAMKLLLVPLLLAGLSAASVAAHESAKPRKSLGFGPVHPHAVFHSNPSNIPQSFGVPQSENPLQLAQSFAEGIVPPHLDGVATFVLRKDSYTDKNTGVTHAYLRQFINGLEVADGDLNVNIKEGIILSYGTSVRDTQSRDMRFY